MSKIRQEVFSWVRFKSLMQRLGDDNDDFKLYQLNECSCYYHLALINDADFVIYLKKGSDEAIEYENNHQNNFTICGRSGRSRSSP